jgi:ATPase family associated with various cellular activities (AAA)
MSDPNEWLEYNNRRLSVALDELRQRLERHIQKQNAKPSAPAPAARVIIPPPPASPSALPSLLAPGKSNTVSRSFFQRLLRQEGAGPASTPPPADAPPPPTPEPAGPPPISATKPILETPFALDIVGEALGLSLFERNVLLLCAAMELDTRIPSLCARAQDDPLKPFPTFALALALFDEPSWDVLSPERPLRHWRLIEIAQSAAQPLTSSALRADERIVNFLKGLNYLDDRFSSFLAPMDRAMRITDLSPSQDAVVESILRLWQNAAETGSLPVMQLLGPDAVSKQLVARHAAAQLQRHLYRLPLELLPAAPADLETLARLWERESRLLPLALYLDAEEIDGAGGERYGPLNRFLSQRDGVFFLGVREAAPRLDRSYATLEVAKPTPAEQQEAWSDLLGAEAPDMAAELAAQFNLNLPKLLNLTGLARRAEGTQTGTPLSERIWAECCASERPHLDALAQRLEPKMTWDDLVLPDLEMKQLRQLAAQVAQRNKVYHDWGFARKMNRGFGISALFEGESGCGKTMAAEVIANGLRLNLYRIDLSAVVNKYIGETEKNLRRLFDAASTGGAILFFDEADALFGKRFEAKDSHDHYANIQINYLLQCVESYRGLAILATNMKGALDSAFMRRLRFIVHFPFPGLADRRLLWQKVFLQEDAGALSSPPLGQLDYNRLARLNLSPGSIHNAALNACFMAADGGTKVTMPMVLQAARAELLKLDRPINEADFRWTEPALAPSPASTAPPAPKLAVKPGEPILL